MKEEKKENAVKVIDVLIKVLRFIGKLFGRKPKK